MNKYVLNHALSQELHKLGLGGPSMFWWKIVRGSDPKLIPQYQREEYDADSIPAFTAPELAQFLPYFLFLPRIITEHERPLKLLFYRDGLNWTTEYVDAQGIPIHQEIARSEAESRAKMIIYLWTNNLTEKS